MLAMPLRYRAQLDIDHLDFTAFLNKPAWQSDLNLQVRLEGEGVAPRELAERSPRRDSPVTPGEHQAAALADRPAGAAGPLPGAALRG